LTNATPSSSHELESRELWPWASVLATSIGWNQAGAAPHMEELYRGSAGATARPTRKEGWRTVACLHATRREEEKKVGSARHVSLFSGRDQRSWSPRRLACRLPTTLLSCSSLLHFTHIMSSHAPSADELPWPASPLSTPTPVCTHAARFFCEPEATDRASGHRMLDAATPSAWLAFCRTLLRRTDVGRAAGPNMAHVVTFVVKSGGVRSGGRRRTRAPRRAARRGSSVQCSRGAAQQATARPVATPAASDLLLLQSSSGVSKEDDDSRNEH
jgi:hypothetical protein